MRLGILYICTGKYEVFWKKFYLSAEQNLLQGIPCIREYFVFTDSPSIYGEDENPHIHRIYQENLGWPDNTLMRFHMFLKIEKKLREQTDYLYFFNANMVIIHPIGLEFLPQGEGNGLIGVRHPGFYAKNNLEYPYEHRRESMAYIPEGGGTCYYQGSLSGGKTMAYLKLCHILQERTDQDKANGIVPVWHDESMINRYFYDNPPQVMLSPSYSFPFWDICIPFQPVILLRNKSDKIYGGHETMRGENKGFFHDFSFKRFIKSLLKRRSLCVRLEGGLGNQMFQYALYRWLQKMYPDVHVKLTCAANSDCLFHNGMELPADFVDLNLSIGKRSDAKTIVSSFFVRTQYLNMDEKLILGYHGDIEYLGYWQRLCYVNAIKNELRLDFMFQPFTSSKNIRLSEFLQQTKDTVFVHVRRGDYLKFQDKYINLGETRYYEQAIHYMQQQVEVPYFVFFSNDIDWCKANFHFSEDKCCFVDWNQGKDSFQDMHLMSFCKHAITANSTFSWWGSWLIPNPDKIVVTPQKWFVAKDTPEIIDIPDDWIQI